jgi:hypothetical protein
VAWVRRFERALQRGWVLQRQLALPGWGCSAPTLTVWMRRRRRQQDQTKKKRQPETRCVIP